MENGNQHYSIDTSALITWWQEYPPEIFEGLKPRMAELIRAGRLRASRSVKDEIKDSDEKETLAKWCKDQINFYYKDDEKVQRRVREIMREFQYPKKTRGISGADPFVIAHAALKGVGWFVVSSERPSNGNEDKNPNIPFVCGKIEVNHITFLELLRKENWTLK